ncbi:aminoglycoside phosphotransferase (APT) family kinase protein [Kribbella pratensis]|uniref:Aminoglycoside phosphotransferase (APT) family kinase protein n=1 Tax=Kribbella pratensis TaxID=2512112 RepID=A0ABY2FL33_9ACTN|nr:phosphotransferase [Kribbella pratensis]TDW93830.1 aminoglycoside phosphotransferase (APT) family kinase protein [Kribbella pratensis]
MSDFAASAVPLTGGYGGQTFAVSAGDEDAVIKFYARDPERAAVDASLLELVRGLLPVPRVLDLKRDGSFEDPPYLLTERLPGINLQVFLESATDEQRRRVGTQLGELLARLSGMPFLRSGMFRGGELTVEPFGFGDLAEYVAGLRLGFDDRQREGFAAVIDEAEDVLADGVHRVCLVHSDFNPKNLLVDPGTVRITGLIDWEFAHAGSPYADLGNLLRFSEDRILAGAVLDALRGTELGERLVDLGRAADLWALLDLAQRAAEHEVAAAAHRLVSRMADTGTLAGGRPDLDVVH